MDKKLEMRSQIEAVFEHYAEQSEYYRRANIAQRIVHGGQILLAHNGVAQQDHRAV